MEDAIPLEELNEILRPEEPITTKEEGIEEIQGLLEVEEKARAEKREQEKEDKQDVRKMAEIIQEINNIQIAMAKERDLEMQQRVIRDKRYDQIYHRLTELKEEVQLMKEKRS